MIAIIKTTYKEIKEFEKKEWRDVNLEHYGKKVDWIEKEFIFKAIKDNKIIGSIICKYESGVVYVDSLIVEKDKRGKGIGKTLLEKAEEYGKKLKAHKIYLFTGKKWETPNHFYKKLGFEKIGELPKHFFKHDFIIYSKFI